MVLVVIDVTDATFEVEVIAGPTRCPWWSTWAPSCGPCRTLGPILEKVVSGTEGAVELVKVNVDEIRGIATTFGVQSIPAVFALRNRQVVDGFVGAIPEAK